jgi:hypothetical protein
MGAEFPEFGGREPGPRSLTQTEDYQILLLKLHYNQRLSQNFSSGKALLNSYEWSSYE